MDSNDNVMYRRSSSSSLPSPSSDYSSSSLGSAYDRKSTGDAGWSDPVTPLKATKDNSASLLIDSGYAGEQPGGGGDRSIPFSKYKFSSRVDERQGSYEAPWTVHLETDGISLVFGFLNKKGLLSWVVTTLVLASVCFSLLYFDRKTSMYCSSSYSNGKYEAIKFGAQQLVKRLQQEGRLLVEVKDDLGNRLGGKKAAMQFVHESIYGKTKLVNLALDLKDDSGEDDGESEKENDFDKLWKLTEELKTLEAILESLQGSEITAENARGVQGEKVDDGENEKNKEKQIDENQSVHGAGNAETAADALGGVESDSGAKLEVEKEFRNRSIAVDETSSLPRSRVRLTEKGMKGRRKALGGLRDEI